MRDIETLIPLKLVKDFLRIIHDSDDEIIHNIAVTAVTLAEHYLGKSFTDNIPESVLHGILLHIRAIYDCDNMDSSIPKAVRAMYIPYKHMHI